MLKLGDKVYCNAGYSFDPSEGTVVKVGTMTCGVSINKARTEASHRKLSWTYLTKSLKKMEAKMSRYDEFKSVIEGCDGWGEAVDNVLVEIASALDKPLYLCIPMQKQSRIEIQAHNRDVIKSFSYPSQCNKLRAFKQACLSLLDSSSIVKTSIVGKSAVMEINGKKYKVEVLGELA